MGEGQWPDRRRLVPAQRHRRRDERSQATGWRQSAHDGSSLSSLSSPCTLRCRNHPVHAASGRWAGGGCRLVRSAHQLRIRRSHIVAPQYTHADAVRRRHPIAVVGQIAADDVRAREIRMDHRLRRSLRLMPVDVAEVTESSIRRSPVVPVRSHGDPEIVVRFHGGPPAFGPRASRVGLVNCTNRALAIRLRGEPSAFSTGREVWQANGVRAGDSPVHWRSPSARR